MNRELAEHISLLAAPIYAVLVVRKRPAKMAADQWRYEARERAIAQALALWSQTLDAEQP